VPLAPLFGHAQLQRQFRDAVARDTLPHSLLLHGPRGVGKQRLALWLGQLLLCTGGGDAESRPCGRCQSCRYAAELAHPDLHWLFPHERPKEADSTDEARARRRELGAGRAKENGLYECPSGSEGIFVADVHALVQDAAMSPALGRRKVFVVGDAERMVAQEGADQAANAFLKLLEEPPADSWMILTSSEPGSLLPTIRSRVVSLRVAPIARDEMRAFLADPLVREALDEAKGLPRTEDERLRLAGGAPGALLSHAESGKAIDQARRILQAAESRDRAAILRHAFAEKPAGARGAFSDTLDALTVLLHERARDAVHRDDQPAALAAARAVEVVEEVKEWTATNVNPQLATASLLRRLEGLLR
jgi:DNA polymerase-3 subunit delta'